MRRRFSEKQGVIKPRTALQVGYIDERLQARLWSRIVTMFLSDCNQWLDECGFTKTIWFWWQDGFLGEPIDDLSDYTPNNTEKMKKAFFENDWAFSYDVVQFFADFAKSQGAGEPQTSLRNHGEAFVISVNEILESENSAYRFVSGELIEISNEAEILSIEEAIAHKPAFQGAEEHLQTALGLFADRTSPDYRNAIKEAISSIESGLTTLNGTKSGNINKALKLAKDKGLSIHPALEKGISSIYGWTSDENGIRHALSEDIAKVGNNEAKLMIVLCSGFLNYLKAHHSLTNSV